MDPVAIIALAGMALELLDRVQAKQENCALDPDSIKLRGMLRQIIVDAALAVKPPEPHREQDTEH